jgi:hypothetical protein
MAADFTTTFTRPKLAQTASVTESLTTTLTADATNKQYIIDIQDTVGGSQKLLKKLILVPSYSGANFTLTVTEYVYAGSATNYSSSTVPPTSAAASSQTYTLTTQDLDAFYTAAGVART